MNVYEKNSNELASMYIVYESPVSQETPELAGISHLLEHMMCCSLDDLHEQFEQHALTMNAYTGTDEVVYYLTGLESELAKFRDLYIQRITQYIPQEKHFLKELGIVKQEYLDHYNNGDSASFMNLLSGKYGVVGAIGSFDALSKVTFEQVKDFHAKVFAKPTKFLYVGPNEYKSNLEFVEPVRHQKISVRNINNDVPLNENSIPLFVLGKPVVSDELFLASVINSMLGYGFSSPLIQELREKQSLCYGAEASLLETKDGHVPFLATSVNIENLEKAKATMIQILKDHEKHMTRERFDRIMENAKISIKMQDQTPTSGALRRILRAGEKRFSVRQNLDLITYEKVMEFYHKAYNPENIEFEILTQKEISEL